MFCDNRVCFGQENELRFTAKDSRGEYLRPTVLINEVARLAPALPATYGGWFLACGRFYEDPSGHPEQCTAEVDDPLQLVASREAGQTWISRAAQRLRQNRLDVRVSRQNIDYISQDPETSWACHCSFSTHSSTRRSAEHLPPYLVSKMIIDGAGGLSPWRRGQVRFSIAPRMELHTRLTGSTTQRQRSLICTRSDFGRPALTGRQHFTCYECLCSHLAEYLRFGTMALVLKLLDAGILQKHPLTLANPVAAISTFASDPTCTARVPLLKGGDISAVEIQRHYLGLAEAHARALFAPAWANAVCRAWRAILDRIALGAPESVVGALDWATRWEVMSSYVHSRGGSWNACEQQLYEIDVRFSEIGPDGFWEQMDADGVLTHRLVTHEQVRHAMNSAPECQTRAKGRGAAILELAREAGAHRHFTAGWDMIEDIRNGRRLVLSDPWNVTGTWHEAGTRISEPEESIPF